MIKSSALRVAVGAEGVSVWSPAIFGDAEPARLREFLSHTFGVQEIAGVELRRAASFARIQYGAVAEPAQIWKKLSRALRFPNDTATSPGSKRAPAVDAVNAVDARLVYLDGANATRVQISRIGAALTTWRVRGHSENTLRLSHPILRNRRDIVYRLEDELAAIFGVEDFRASALTASVSIRFDHKALSLERLARDLEKAWPRLLDGVDRPPSRKRLFAAAGLVGLAFTGQYLAPAVRPIAVAGVALYSSPNVVGAVKQLRRGQVGIYVLYATGLGFMLASGLPFASAVIAVLMQLWPDLAHRKLVRSQRRVFAGQRRRPSWVRIPQNIGDRTDIEVDVGDLRKGDLVSVRPGDIVPVDGIVTDGYAAVIEDTALGSELVEDKAKGDPIAAGAFVRAGSLTIRIERSGAQTVASYVDSLLPRGVIVGLPSSLEAERIANRNAKPTLTLAALSFFLTRTPRVSQALIRPDYATAPRLSAQLSALHGVARGLQRGVLFRNPAALDRLAEADVYVIDDSAGLERRRVEVATVQTAKGATAPLIVGFALAAYPEPHSEQGWALAAYASKRKTVRVKAEALARSVGVTRYRDSLGGAIEIATSRYLAASKLDVPANLRIAPDRGVEHPRTDKRPSLWVIRDGHVIGVVSFARTGDLVGEQVVAALKEQNQRARIIYVSDRSEAAVHTLARKLGIEFSFGDLTGPAKVDLIRGLGRKSVWIGDGSEPNAREPIAASTVSVSIAPLSHAREDAADILLPHQGLEGLPGVIELGRAHAARLAQDYRTVYAANLLGVAGAFFARFNSLQAGLISNFSTGLIYARHARALDRLAAVAEHKRGRLLRSS
jgi:cation-transporting P-type ATPase C